MECFATTSDGLLFAANGIDPVLRWDGSSYTMEEAGLAAPTAAVVMSGSLTGEITGTYYAYIRFVGVDGNVSSLSPLAGPLEFTNVGRVNYDSVPTPQSANVARRQILRNTAGQASVFYVDVDTDDLTSTSFTSTKLDGELQAQEAVALFDIDGKPLANTHDVPPADKAIMAPHLDRMFLAGEEIYRDGNVAVTFGSKTVSGIGTEWPATLAGRFLWVTGADKIYEIESVDPLSQTLTLLEAYESETDPFSPYAIRPSLANRKMVQYSQPGLPGSWPPFNAVFVQEDNDDITGLMQMGSFLYILERRHIYRMTFQESPDKDGYIFYSCGRGCVNNRSWAVVGEEAYLLDEAGVYVFSGTRQTENVSAPIQDLFEPHNPRQRYRVRFDGSRYFHAVYDPGAQTIRFFVTLEGTGVPRHALCMNLAEKAWWVEEYPFPIGGSCVGTLGGHRRVFLGGPGGQVYLLGRGTLDAVDAARGTVRGRVTGRSPLSLEDAGAVFGDDVVGAPVVIVSGRGKRQMRQVVRVDGARLTIDRPWRILPSTGDVYQIGGIRWRYRTGWFRYAYSEIEGPRRLEILYEPCRHPQTLNASLYEDRSRTPVQWGSTYDGGELTGLGSVQGEDTLEGNMAGGLGIMQRRLDGHKETYIDGPRQLSWELDGVTNRDEATIYQITLDGAVDGSGR